MKIVYQDKEIIIEPKKIKTTVKELLKYLRPNIQSADEEELVLIEKKSDIIDKLICLDQNAELDLETISNNQEFILIIINSNTQFEEKHKEPIEKLVMQVTNAKEQINPLKASKKRPAYPKDDHMEYIEHILSTGNLSMNNVRLRAEIANLLNNPIGAGEGTSLNSFFGLNYTGYSNPSSSSQNGNLTNTNTALNNNNTDLPNLIPSNMPIIRQRPPKIEANPEFVQNLVDMGFEEVRAKRALIASKNNLNHATEMILNGYDMDLPDSGLFSGKTLNNEGNYSQILFDNAQIPQLDIQNNNQVPNENVVSQEYKIE
jgi:hypothetical protein